MRYYNEPVVLVSKWSKGSAKNISLELRYFVRWSLRGGYYTNLCIMSWEKSDTSPLASFLHHPSHLTLSSQSTEFLFQLFDSAGKRYSNWAKIFETSFSVENDDFHVEKFELSCRKCGFSCRKGWIFL